MTGQIEAHGRSAYRIYLCSCSVGRQVAEWLVLPLWPCPSPSHRNIASGPWCSSSRANPSKSETWSRSCNHCRNPHGTTAAPSWYYTGRDNDMPQYALGTTQYTVYPHSRCPLSWHQSPSVAASASNATHSPPNYAAQKFTNASHLLRW